MKTINIDNNNKFRSKYVEFENFLDNAISTKNYEEILKLVPGKMLLNRVAELFDLSNGNAYQEKILLCLIENKDLQQELKNIISFTGDRQEH